MKKFFVFLVLLIGIPFVFANEQAPSTTPQNINFENCTKIFAVNKEKLFYLTLASLSANRFLIDEVQTSNGYVVFTVNRNQYLATIAGVDSTNAILKITPCNNLYKYPPGSVTKTFQYFALKLISDNKS